MYSYVVDEKKHVIYVKEGENVVGELKYSVQAGYVFIDMYKISVNEKNPEFSKCFEMLTTISKGVQSTLGTEKEVVWGSLPEVKDFDMYVESLDQEHNQKTTKARR